MRKLLTIPLAALLLAGCGGSSGSGSSSSTPTTTQTSAPSGARTVAISNFKFAPATLTVAVGTRVTWTNHDSAPHTASATGLETGTLTQGKSRTLTLSKPGTYHYVCQFHSFMHGTIVVR
jgi:plastocyanin